MREWQSSFFKSVLPLVSWDVVSLKSSEAYLIYTIIYVTLVLPASTEGLYSTLPGVGLQWIAPQPSLTFIKIGQDYCEASNLLRISNMRQKKWLPLF